VTRTVTTLIAGRATPDGPGGRLTVTNPARLDEVVAEALDGGRRHLRRCLPGGQGGPAWMDRCPRSDPRPCRPADRYHPAIVEGVTAEDELYRTETFGPIVGVASFDTLEQAIDLANGHGYGLSSAIYRTIPGACSGSARGSPQAWSR
jgi:hypothetical protein